MQDHNDPRSDEMKRTMAEHFEEMEAEYRDNDWGSIVYEDSEVVVVADHKGNEANEWSNEFGREFRGMMHSLATQVTDHSWSTDYPIVFDKMEN